MALRAIPVLALLAIVPAPARAQPAPSWADVPALMAAAAAPVDDALRACLTSPAPRALSLVASRARDGHTQVAMPLLYVGILGPTKEDRCLGPVIARIALPPLPDAIDRIGLLHVVTAAGAAPPAIDPAFAAWRDPAATLDALLDDTHRGALAACDRRPRTVRLIVDRVRGATRIWLPAWQFHAASHDGTTPPAQRAVKACLRRAIRAWRLPVLPRGMGDLAVAIPTASVI